MPTMTAKDDIFLEYNFLFMQSDIIAQFTADKQTVLDEFT